MGTPDFAVPALEVLARSDVAQVSLVVTQPDRPAGRGKKLAPPAVKSAAEQLGLPVLQAGTLRDPLARQQITDVRPDLIVVAAFGMILGKWILELPSQGCVNLHASLLPKYRGANPIAAAIAMGEIETGVTLMHMDRGLDTGGIYAAASIPVESSDTTETLTPRLATLTGQLLEAHLQSLLQGQLDATPQPPGATLTRQMTKDDGWLDFTRPAMDLERHVRAMWSWPRAWTTTEAGERLQVHRAGAVSGMPFEPGRVMRSGKRVLVGTGHGALELLRVQMPGGRPIEGNAMLQVSAFSDGAVIGRTGAPRDLLPLVTPVDATDSDGTRR
jgi:methionyl-tRNA formyltransferase